VEKANASFHRIARQNNGNTSPLPAASQSSEWFFAPSLDEGDSVARNSPNIEGFKTLLISWTEDERIKGLFI
jgi:hypothetical protein